ncbi:hypothetical protein C2G38_2117843 [Gigaspora rosea]|uniref:Uncharacterized protein n=1 Tax=Gigaspora rosea TaxID=44941 RepID=A0A397U7H9_9GLOM|nr:hypothetical protein C2G38_2117843 [Gigaspora rosea]
MDFEKSQPTRLLYDDSDSEFEELDDKTVDSLGPPVLRLSHFKNTKFLTNTLLIGINGGGNLFLESISSNKRLIGTILLPEIELIRNTLNQENGSNQGCFIYEMESSPKTLLIPCNYKVNDERCFIWTKTLFNHIEAERVIIFDIFKLSSYIFNHREEHIYPYCRVLSSNSALEMDKSIPIYQPPNLVCNLSAAILSHCELYNISAYLLLNPQTEKIGMIQIYQEYQKILNQLNLNLELNFKYSFDEKPSIQSDFKRLYV